MLNVNKFEDTLPSVSLTLMCINIEGFVCIHI